MRYRKAIDANQKEIVAALRAAGWKVHDTHALGGGIPDLAVWREGGPRVWVEIKMPGEKVTEAERAFFSAWGAGDKLIVYGAEDALEKLRAFDGRSNPCSPRTK